jgi:hypothetical protein
MAARFPELQDAAWLRRKYLTEGLSSGVIAAQLGCRATTVSRALGRHGIEARLGRPAAVRPGQVYGRLTVVAELPERRRGGRVFRCRCICGGEAEVEAGELRRGKVHSCGCLHDEGWPSGHVPPPTVQPGERYGRLVVVREAGRGGRGQERKFICRCDCGNATTVRASNLTSGHTRSCGCLLAEYRRRGSRAHRSARKAPGEPVPQLP